MGNAGGARGATGVGDIADPNIRPARVTSEIPNVRPARVRNDIRPTREISCAPRAACPGESGEWDSAHAKIERRAWKKRWHCGFSADRKRYRGSAGLDKLGLDFVR